MENSNNEPIENAESNSQERQRNIMSIILLVAWLLVATLSAWLLNPMTVFIVCLVPLILGLCYCLVKTKIQFKHQDGSNSLIKRFWNLDKKWRYGTNNSYIIKNGALINIKKLPKNQR